jgi:hypothetical protein
VPLHLGTAILPVLDLKKTELEEHKGGAIFFFVTLLLLCLFLFGIVSLFLPRV